MACSEPYENFDIFYSPKILKYTSVGKGRLFWHNFPLKTNFSCLEVPQFSLVLYDVTDQKSRIVTPIPLKSVEISVYVTVFTDPEFRYTTNLTIADSDSNVTVTSTSLQFQFSSGNCKILGCNYTFVTAALLV